MMLQRHAAMNKMKLDITVVESSRVPTVGVGEGTTAVFRQMIIELGVDEAAFIRETGATIKFDSARSRSGIMCGGSACTNRPAS